MKRILFTSLLVACALTTATVGQTRLAPRSRAAALVENRLARGGAVQLQADSITLTGDRLSLEGHAVLHVDDSSVFVDVAILDRATKHVELRGDNVRVFYGRSATPVSDVPRIDFR